ncbi:hypothetical protein LIER_02571 [Lithospermum erythrorhizon]|uniref:CCHC-type domain-containing protein n=1 Tax=Lithospermum erythrorhizon TaxID=34254 RepID=A0AAV3NPY6_LITER
MCNMLRRDFEMLEMTTKESISDYFARVNQIANKLRSNGEELTETKIVQKILRTLTSKYTYIVVSIEESHDVESMSVDELESSLAMHSQKFQRFTKETTDDDQVLKVEGRFNNLSVRGRGSGSYRGSSSYRGKGRSGGRGYSSKASVECYKCHGFGHYQYECPLWNKQANYTAIDDEDDLLLMTEVNAQTNQADKKVWYMDSGCSNHMCNCEDMFTTLDRSFTHSVNLGNNSKLEVKGKRSGEASA